MAITLNNPLVEHTVRLVLASPLVEGNGDLEAIKILANLTDMSPNRAASIVAEWALPDEPLDVSFLAKDIISVMYVLGPLQIVKSYPDLGRLVISTNRLSRKLLDEAKISFLLD